jgi:protein-tyrosine phosphatase
MPAASAPVGFVDVHTHMVPSGDDGPLTIAEALPLCREAARRGTTILYGTPHVNDELPLTVRRETIVRSGARELTDLLHAEGLEIRVGFEVHPGIELDGKDPARYRLDHYDAVLVECPLEAGDGRGVDRIFTAAEQIEAAGLLPILAHPERSPALLADASAISAAARRGWLSQVTAASLLGRHGDIVGRFAWSLLERAEAQIVASDGHRPDRPPFLDEVLAAISSRFGDRRAAQLLDGSALRSAAAP